MPAEHHLPPWHWRIAFRVLTLLLRALGAWRYVLADTGGRVWRFTDLARYHRTTANHRRAAPAITPAEARRRARASMREYARTTVDFVWAAEMPRLTVLRHSRVVGLDIIRAAESRGRGGILALTHFGSWDMAANIALAYGLSLTTVMAPIGSERITELVMWARRRNELEVFTSDNAVRGLLRAPRAGRFVAMLADVPDDGPTVQVGFCGGTVAFSSVPAWLAGRTGAPLLPVDCRRGRTGYVITIHPAVPVAPEDDAQAITTRLAGVLERSIAATPAQWYPFGHVYVDG